MTATVNNPVADVDAPLTEIPPLGETPKEIVLEQWTLDLFDPIAQAAGFVDYTVVPSAGSNVGDGFMGIMLRILIQGRRSGHHDQMSVMLKMPPFSKARQKAFNSAVMFKRESYIYRTILPTFVEFQRSKGLAENDPDGFFRFPIVHAVVCDDELDRYAIVMEDLKAGDFVMFDKFKVIDLDHIRLVVSELAKFHALSFALHDQQPEVFEPFANLKCVFLEYMLMGQREMMDNFRSMVYGKTIEALAPEEVELKRKVQVMRENFMEQMEECVKLRKDLASVNVVNHGDCWNNNMMYWYETGVSEIYKTNKFLLYFEIISNLS